MPPKGKWKFELQRFAEPGPAGVEPVLDAATVAGPVAGADDQAMSTAMGLYNILQSNPALADQVADMIEKTLGGSPAQPEAAPAAASAITPPMNDEMAQLVQALAGRVGSLENTNADTLLQKELSETKQNYEKMRQGIPILPELDEKALLQLSMDKNGMPLSDTLQLWAMQQMMSGEGSPADRIAAAMMEKSKVNETPAVEGKGGSIPTGEAPKPGNFRQARRGAKAMVNSLSAGNIGI